MFKKIILLSVIILLLFLSTKQEDKQFNQIVGCIYYTDSLPRAWTIVSLYNGNKLIAENPTDWESGFALMPLPLGKFTLVARRVGYRTKVIENVVVNKLNTTDTISFLLEKLQKGEVEDYSKISKEEMKTQIEDEKTIPINFNRVDSLGQKQGNWYYYNEKSTNNSLCKCKVLKAKGKYVNNLEVGKWIYFDESGNTIRTILYKNGKLKK